VKVFDLASCVYSRFIILRQRCLICCETPRLVISMVVVVVVVVVAYAPSKMRDLSKKKNRSDYLRPNSYSDSGYGDKRISE
jgi:hypothetical protein